MTKGAKGPKGRRDEGTKDVRVSALVHAPLSSAEVARIATSVLLAEKAKVAALSITFVGPARMKTLNRKHLARHRETDVIAFALGPPVMREIVGDVYICPAVAAKSAKQHGTTARDEVRRLVVHGVLHVLGQGHPEADRTASAMWQAQERHLARLSRPAR